MISGNLGHLCLVLLLHRVDGVLVRLVRALHLCLDLVHLPLVPLGTLFRFGRRHLGRVLDLLLQRSDLLLVISGNLGHLCLALLLHFLQRSFLTFLLRLICALHACPEVALHLAYFRVVCHGGLLCRPFHLNHGIGIALNVGELFEYVAHLCVD